MLAIRKTRRDSAVIAMLPQLLGGQKRTEPWGKQWVQILLSILIPCHRILAKNQAIGGFAWGVDLKKMAKY